MAQHTGLCEFRCYEFMSPRSAIRVLGTQRILRVFAGVFDSVSGILDRFVYLFASFFHRPFLLTGCQRQGKQHGQ
jgi:hypothetical protein